MQKLPKRFDHDKQLPPPPPPPPFASTRSASGSGSRSGSVPPTKNGSSSSTSSISNISGSTTGQRSLSSNNNKTSLSSTVLPNIPPPRPEAIGQPILGQRANSSNIPPIHSTTSNASSVRRQPQNSGLRIAPPQLATTISTPNTSGNQDVKIEQNTSGSRASIYSGNSSLFKPRTLKRRNLKALTIDGQSVDDANVGQDTGLSPLRDMNALSVKDPDAKISTDELVTSVNNLELGVEYQLSIKAEDLLTLKKLGSGNSGTVSKVLHLPSKKTMARKIIHIDTKEAVLRQIIRELHIMHECDSQYIIGFYGAFLKEGDVVICMEYADCGSLDKTLKISGPFPEYMLKQAALSVLRGLIYLYDTHKIIHRDVKPSNVLMDSKGNMKLCDFGVSRELINSIADTFVGTSTYMSPERIQGNRYNIKGDVWSLGLMLIELATGVFPFGDSSKMAPEGILDLLQSIVNERPPSLSPKDGYSPELCNFIDICLKKENERWEPAELIKHPFLADVSQYRTQVKQWAKNIRKLQKGKILIPSSTSTQTPSASAS